MPVIRIGENTADDFSGTLDTFMRESAPTLPQDDPWIEISKAAVGEHRNALVWFDIANAVPAGAAINSVTINLYLQNYNAASVTIDIHRLLVSWVEASATWNTRNGVDAWNSPGALGVGADHDATLLAQSVVTALAGLKTFSGANLTQFVQDIVDGSIANNGFLLLRNGAGNDGEYDSFGSSEAATDGQRLYIEIDYTEASGVTVGGSVQAQDATVSGATSNDPVSAIVFTTITTAGSVGGSVQAQDATVSGSVIVVPATPGVSVGGSVQAQDATVEGGLNVVPPQTVVLGGSVQAQDATVSGALSILGGPNTIVLSGSVHADNATIDSYLNVILNYDLDANYYCSAQHMIARFGLEELIQLTNQDNIGATSIDQGVLSRAISDASGFIDGYLSGRYKIPLEIVPTVLVRIACDITRYFLYDDAVTERVQKNHDVAIKFLESAAKGIVSLGVDALGAKPQTTNSATMTSGGRIMGRNDNGFL